MHELNGVARSLEGDKGRKEGRKEGRFRFEAPLERKDERERHFEIWKEFLVPLHKNNNFDLAGPGQHSRASSRGRKFTGFCLPSFSYPTKMVGVLQADLELEKIEIKNAQREPTFQGKRIFNQTWF